MKAYILQQPGNAENLVAVDIPVPTYKKDELLIKVNAISINPVDVKTRKGLALYESLKADEPVIVGWDISGEVVEMGEEVTKFQVGEEVFGMVNFPGHGKAYAEYIVAAQDQLADKPDQISSEEAAASTLAALTAWQVLVDQANVQAGEKVLIHAAAGGVGHFAVQIAKYLGANVIGTASEANYDFVKELGADDLVDYKHEVFEEVVKDVDVVFDTVGGDNPKRSLMTLKNGGRLVAIAGGITDEVKNLASKNNITAIAYLVSSNGDDMEQLAELLEAGIIKPHVSHVFPFTELVAAHKQVETGSTRGKVVVTLE